MEKEMPFITISDGVGSSSLQTSYRCLTVAGGASLTSNGEDVRRRSYLLALMGDRMVSLL